MTSLIPVRHFSIYYRSVFSIYKQDLFELFYSVKKNEDRLHELVTEKAYPVSLPSTYYVQYL